MDGIGSDSTVDRTATGLMTPGTALGHHARKVTDDFGRHLIPHQTARVDLGGGVLVIVPHGGEGLTEVAAMLGRWVRLGDKVLRSDAVVLVRGHSEDLLAQLLFGRVDELVVQGVERGVREASDLDGAEGCFGAWPGGAGWSGLDGFNAVGESDARIHRRLYAGVFEDVVENGGGCCAHVVGKVGDGRGRRRGAFGGDECAEE